MLVRRLEWYLYLKISLHLEFSFYNFIINFSVKETNPSFPLLLLWHYWIKTDRTAEAPRQRAIDGLTSAGLLSYITVHTAKPVRAQSPKPQKGFKGKHRPITYINSSCLMFNTYTSFFPCKLHHSPFWWFGSRCLWNSVRPVWKKKKN